MFPLLVLPLVVSAATAPASTVLPSADGHIALAQGVLSGPHSGDLQDAAVGFALLHRNELGLPVTSSLGKPESFSTRFGGSVHLPQLVDGVEVHGGKVIVTFDLQGRVVRVASSLRPYVRSVVSWNLSGAEALRVGAREIDGALFRSDGAPHGG